MTKKDNIIIALLIIVLVVLLCRFFYLFYEKEYSSKIIQHINTSLIASDIEKKAVLKIVNHIQKSFPFPVFIQIQKNEIDEANVLKLFKLWNKNNPLYNHYCLFLLFSFKSHKVYFIAGERLRIFINMKKIDHFLENEFLIDIENEHFSRAINNWAKILFDELKDDKALILKGFHKAKHSNIEKIKQKWYFIILSLIIALLISIVIKYSKTKLRKKAKTKREKKIEQLSSLKKDWK